MPFGYRTISMLLAGTAFVAFPVAALAQEPEPQEGEPIAVPGEEDVLDEAIVVTGTRIRGARTTSEVVTLSRGAIVEAGQIDLGEALRSLPQNFSGGQNPGVGTGAGLTNENVNSGSSANLRGLGADATLTLLNGQRLPYNSAFQGVDISAIPLAAVDRIEILPDGASAIYGSDAVAGVINVVLRRDFEGVTTSAQIGTSTDGGNFRQQADLVAGTNWDGGGVMIAYDFANNSSIRAGQRDYASIQRPENTLLPSMQRHAVTLSARQAIAPGIKANVDALYSYRESVSRDGDASEPILREPTLEGFSIAPSLVVDVGPRWHATLAGVFGRDQTRFRTSFFPVGGTARTNTGGYKNEITSVELGLEGPVFALPGGDARLALGAGLWDARLDYEVETPFFASSFDETQRARFAYAELYMPIVSGANEIPGIELLTLSAAVRYEDYRDLDQLATPRIGLNYAPIEGLTFRGGWSRSFKAPTLFQRNVLSQAILVPAAVFGAGSGDETIFLTGGGNPDLRAERARSWTFGFDVEPASIPDLTFSATWYDIRYDDRVTAPISGSIAAAIANPGYAGLISFDPDPALLAELVAAAELGLENFTGQPFDPANVVVLFDNRNINVAAWQIEGVDARVAWDRSLGEDRSIGFDLGGTWLTSSQVITSQLPVIPLAGTVFNPPKYRGRGTIRLQWDGLVASTALNYIGALVDDLPAGRQRLSPQVSFDLGLSYTLVRGTGRDPGIELSLTVQNLFDREPEVLNQASPTTTPFDSTNYSAIGRFIAFGIRRHW